MQYFRLTSKKIGKAIEARTGIADVGVFVDREKGNCFFYSDNPMTATLLTSFETTSAYVPALNRLTLAEWVETFEYLLTDALH